MHADGEVIGRVRSAGYGFTVRRNVALAKLPAELEEGAAVDVDVLGELVPAESRPMPLRPRQRTRAELSDCSREASRGAPEGAPGRATYRATC